MYVRDLDATGATIVTTPTMGFTIKILPQKSISSHANCVVQRIRTADHLSGTLEVIIVVGGGMENVKMSRTIHFKKQALRRAEKVNQHS